MGFQFFTSGLEAQRFGVPSLGAPFVDAPRGVSGRGDPLILGYQKSGVTPAAYPARHGCANGAEGKFTEIKTAAPLLGSVGLFAGFGLTHDTSSAVAGFGGRRFLVLQHEEAAKDCRCAGSSKNALAANPNQRDHGRPTKALRDNATRKLTHFAH